MSEYVWIKAPGWRMLPEGTTRHCRMREGHPLCARRCTNIAVAELLRGRVHQTWWSYCAEHLYGRRIREGQVEEEVLP